MVENCYQKHKTVLNPIIDWTDEDIWDFIRGEHIPYCSLYDCGKCRLGCIGCPKGGHAEEELTEYPVYRANYIRAFEKMLLARERLGKQVGKTLWKTGEDVMDWWLRKIKLDEQLDGQMEL